MTTTSTTTRSATQTTEQVEAPPWTQALTVTVHHPDGGTTTATVASIIDRDDVAGTIRVETLLAEPGDGALAIVRHTRDAGDGTSRTTTYAAPHTPRPEPGVWCWTAPHPTSTVTGHEQITGEQGPIRLRNLRRRDVCPKCRRVHPGDQARAVGMFSGPRGYRASTAPNAPLRATRMEAEADECAWTVSRLTT